MSARLSLRCSIPSIMIARSVLPFILFVGFASGCGEKKLSEAEQQAAQANYDRGVAYLLSPVYDKALILEKAMRELHRCLNIDPNHLWARWALGMAYMKLGEFPAARDSLNSLAGKKILNPDLAFATHYYLGVAYLRLACLGRGDYHEAIPPLKKAIDLVPSSSKAKGKLLTAKWNLRIAYYASDHRYPDDLSLKYRLTIPSIPAHSTTPPVRFSDVAREVGVAVVNLGRGSSWGDYDRDGDLDLFTVAEGSSHHLYRHDGSVFTDVTTQAGLSDPRGGWASLFADYDNDGDLDIYVTRDGWKGRGPNTLYRNNGDGTFTDATERAGVNDLRDSFCAAFGDYDNDGWLDLYVANGVSTESGAPNTLYRNNQDGTFANVTAQAGVEGRGRSIGTAFGDYDNDGDLDLYVVNIEGVNTLYRNNGNGTFNDVTVQAGVGGPEDGPNNGFVTFFFDYNNDGWLDIFVSGWTPKMEEVIESRMAGKPVAGKRSVLYCNNKDGTFADVTVEAGLARTVGAMAATFGDVDSDGYYDIYLACGGPPIDRLEPDLLYHNNGDGTFTDVTNVVGLGNLGKGHGTTMADYDDDGDLDIYSPEGGMGGNPGDTWPHSLYRNDGTSNHWLIVELIGTKSNRDGVGTKVTVFVGSELRYAEVSGGCGFGVTNSLPVEFGLGRHTRVDQVRIVWPSGIVQVFKDLAVDRKVKIVEGKNPDFRRMR